MSGGLVRCQWGFKCEDDVGCVRSMMIAGCACVRAVCLRWQLVFRGDRA